MLLADLKNYHASNVAYYQGLCVEEENPRRLARNRRKIRMHKAAVEFLESLESGERLVSLEEALASLQSDNARLARELGEQEAEAGRLREALGYALKPNDCEGCGYACYCDSADKDENAGCCDKMISLKEIKEVLGFASLAAPGGEVG